MNASPLGGATVGDASLTARASGWWRLTWLLAAAGAALRCVEYAAHRSLWLDESSLALNILRRNVAGLLHPLDFNQGAPTFFLLLEKGSASVLGTSEYGLRAVPLLAGLAAIPVFVAVVGRVASGIVVPIAVGLFAIAEGPIYYASEVKPYSTDVLACLTILLCAMLAIRPQPARRLALLGLAGAAAMALSFPAIIAGGASALAVVWTAIRRREPRATHALELAIGWLAAAGVCAIAAAYELRHLRHTLHLAVTTGSPRDAGLPLLASLPVTNIAHGLQNFIQAQADLLGLPHGTGASALAGDAVAVLALVGAVRLFRRRTEIAVLVIAPVVAALLAIGVGAYPLFSRTVLFALPYSLILIAEGLAAFAEPLVTRRRRAAALVLVAALAAAPVASAARRVVDPPRYEDLRPALTYLRARQQPRDSLYLFYSSQYAFAYYASCGCTDAIASIWPAQENHLESAEQYSPALRSVPPRIYIGTKQDDLAAYVRQLQPLRGGPRVWVLFSHANDQPELRLERNVVSFLDQSGQRLSTYERRGIRLYLYDLR